VFGDFNEGLVAAVDQNDEGAVASERSFSLPANWRPRSFAWLARVPMPGRLVAVIRTRRRLFLAAVGALALVGSAALIVGHAYYRSLPVHKHLSAYQQGFYQGVWTPLLADNPCKSDTAQEGADPKCVALLRQVLQASPDPSRRVLLAPLVSAAAFRGIDQMLEQIRGIGRQRMVCHVESARFGGDMIVMVDADPGFDWVLPTSQRRLSERLSQLDLEVDPSKTQTAELVPGRTLHFMGVELRTIRNGRGGLTVHWQGARKTKARQPSKRLPLR
jgi:hypothetical protein